MAGRAPAGRRIAATAAAGRGVTFRPCRPADRLRLQRLMAALYREDPAGRPVTGSAIVRTLRALAADPARGSAVVFWRGGGIVGYAILVNFWSNEHGGNVVHIDELYVAPTHRGRGIGSSFIEGLRRQPGSAVALALEVTPRNRRALQLYRRLGFVRSANTHLEFILK